MSHGSTDSSVLFRKYVPFLRVAVVVRQGAATSHSPLWRGAATQHGDNRHRQKGTVFVIQDTRQPTINFS